MQFVSKFTEEQIVEILESRTSDRKTAAEYGVTRETIRKIRIGETHAKVRPEIRRRTSASCNKCQHWLRDRCSFGFPDPIEEGQRAARDCNMYAVISP